MIIIREIGILLVSLYYMIRYKRYIKSNGLTYFYCDNKSKIKFTGRVTFNSAFVSNLIGLYQRCIIVARDGGQIILGDNVGLSGVTIYSLSKIEIGNNVLVGANTKIIDNDFHPLEYQYRIKNDRSKIRKKSIRIGDNCFIGANCIILPGTKLGNNCIVGAGSVVKGEFSDNSIIAGNPAKVIRNIEQ